MGMDQISDIMAHVFIGIQRTPLVFIAIVFIAIVFIAIVFIAIVFIAIVFIAIVFIAIMSDKPTQFLGEKGLTTAPI